MILGFYFDKIVFVNLGGEEMPNIKSAIKRVKGNTKKGAENNTFKSKMKNSIKAVLKACKEKNAEEAEKLYKIATKNIDKALKHNIIKKNAAARYKSNLAKHVNNAK